MSAALLFARDPGAANHVVGVADVLAGRLPCIPLCRLIETLAGTMPARVLLWATGPALSVFAAAGLDACEEPVFDVADVTGRLANAEVRLIVTGTGDIDDRATRILWLAARSIGVPSIAALDSSDNLGFRFDLAAGERPDHLLAADAASAAALVRFGFPGDAVLTTGNLHHQRLARSAAPDRDGVRWSWGVTADEHAVLFVSENAAEARAMGRPVAFDEFSLLDGLIEDVAAGRAFGPLRSARSQAVIVIRPHPRDVPGKYDRYVRGEAPRIIVAAHGTPAEAAAAADIVVGMRSAFLDEADILGRPVHRLV